MARRRRFFGQVVLVLAVMAAAFVGAKLGLLSSRDARASHNFSDVPDSAFYHAFVQFLVDNGITSGCGGGRFCGEDPVTRGQMAVFLKKLSDTFEIVRHFGTFTATAIASNTVNCPTGKRPLSGGGITDQDNLFITDIGIESTRVTVRWESDNDAAVTGTSEVWALCAPV